MGDRWGRMAIGIGALVLAVVIGACGGAGGDRITTVGDIEVVNPVVPEPPTDLGSAYMTIRNTGSAPDRLLSIRTDVAGVVELHQTKAVDGRLGMVQVESVDIAPGGEFDMQIGGFHVMLIDLKRRLKRGDELPLTLVFSRAGEVHVKALVVATAGGAEPHSGHGG